MNEELLALRRAERTGRHQLIVRLREMADGLFAELGYASIVDYGVRALKLSARVTKDMLELGRRLLELPRIDAAMAAGELDWTKARDMQRIATSETDEAWAKYGKTASSRQVDRAVRAARQGDGLPPEEGQRIVAPRYRRRVLGFEAVEAELIDRLVAAVRADTGAAAVTAEEAIVALIRQELARREGCPPREDQPAACDGEIADAPPSPPRGRVSPPMPPPTRRALAARGGWKRPAPGGLHGPWLHIHDLLSLAFGGDRLSSKRDARGAGWVAAVDDRVSMPRATTGANDPA